MPSTAVKTRWVDGSLVFYDVAGAEIFRVDGTNRKLTVHASATLESGGGSFAGVTNPIAGVAASYKVARGEATLDGSNPTTVVSGLATVVAVVVTDKRATAPALDPTHFTVDYGGGVTAGSFNIYAWKPTGAGDATLIASTDADDVISWVAVGT